MKIFKFFKIILILIFCCHSISFAYNPIWITVDSVHIPPNQEASYEFPYEAIACPDNNNCIAIGNMMKKMPWNRVTTDGGNTWFTSLADSNMLHNAYYNSWKLFNVAYPNTNLCIIISDSNYVYRSTDNSKSWVKSNLNGQYTKDGGKFIVNMLNGRIGGILTPFELFLTKDSCKSWLKTKVVFDDSKNVHGFEDLQIIDENIIKILFVNSKATRAIIQSNDWGKTWTTYDSTPRKIYRINFINELEGWGCGGEQIQYGSSISRNIITHTKDGGRTWELQLDTLPENKMGLAMIKFFDSKYGIALGYWWNIWSTSDGGKNWILDETCKYPKTRKFLVNFSFLPNRDILWVTEDALIYKTTFFSDVDSDKKENIIENLSLSPNPATDFLEISYSPSINRMVNHTVDGITIYDVLGECIKEIPLNTPFSKGEITLDVSTLSPGVYFVKVGEKVGKFVKL